MSMNCTMDSMHINVYTQILLWTLTHVPHQSIHTLPFALAHNDSFRLICNSIADASIHYELTHF